MNNPKEQKVLASLGLCAKQGGTPDLLIAAYNRAKNDAERQEVFRDAGRYACDMHTLLLNLAGQLEKVNKP